MDKFGVAPSTDDFNTRQPCHLYVHTASTLNEHSWSMLSSRPLSPSLCACVHNLLLCACVCACVRILLEIESARKRTHTSE